MRTNEGICEDCSALPDIDDGPAPLLKINIPRMVLESTLLMLLALTLGVGMMWLIYSEPNNNVPVVIPAGAVCWLAGLLSLLPMLLLRYAGREWLAQSFIMMMGVRLIGTLIGGVVVCLVFIEPEMRKLFGLSTAVFYIVFLVWETVSVVGIVNKLYGRPIPDKANQPQDT